MLMKANLYPFFKTDNYKLSWDNINEYPDNLQQYNNLVNSIMFSVKRKQCVSQMPVSKSCGFQNKLLVKGCLNTFIWYSIAKKLFRYNIRNIYYVNYYNFISDGSPFDYLRVIGDILKINSGKIVIILPDADDAVVKLFKKTTKTFQQVINELDIMINEASPNHTIIFNETEIFFQHQSKVNYKELHVQNLSEYELLNLLKEVLKVDVKLRVQNRTESLLEEHIYNINLDGYYNDSNEILLFIISTYHANNPKNLYYFIGQCLEYHLKNTFQFIFYFSRYHERNLMEVLGVFSIENYYLHINNLPMDFFNPQIEEERVYLDMDDQQLLFDALLQYEWIELEWSHSQNHTL